MTRTFSVINFEKYQHYRNRTPPWIKLYNRLLDDYAFGRLPDASKAHLVAIWLLASRSDNRVPMIPPGSRGASTPRSRSICSLLQAAASSRE